jgi:hypothetical protein
VADDANKISDAAIRLLAALRRRDDSGAARDLLEDLAQRDEWADIPAAVREDLERFVAAGGCLARDYVSWLRDDDTAGGPEFHSLLLPLFRGVE